jgi:hypothetical protein
MGLNWDRLTLEGYWRIGNVKAVRIGSFPVVETKNLNANDEAYLMAA